MDIEALYINNGFIKTSEVRRILKLQQWQLAFLLDNRMLVRYRAGKSFFFDKDDIDKFPREKLGDMMNAVKVSKEKNKEVKDWNKKDLFQYISDYKAVEFCELVKKGYRAKEIIEKLNISKATQYLVKPKIKYLKGE